MYRIKRLHVHPNYVRGSKALNSNNIVLLELHEYLNKTTTEPINLSDKFNEVKVSMAGWELDELQTFGGKVVETSQCNNLYKGGYRLSEDQICASFSRSSCDVSKGAPLVSGRNELVGIFIGYPDGSNCEELYPAVFTSTVHHGVWINVTLESYHVYIVIGIAALIFIEILTIIVVWLVVKRHVVIDDDARVAIRETEDESRTAVT